MRRTWRAVARCLGLDQTRCLSCGALVPAGTMLCPHCVRELAPRTGGFCPVCGTMWGDGNAPAAPCLDCRLNPPPWDALAFYGRHAGRLRELILGYKFRQGLNREHLLVKLATRAARTLPVPDALVPVPLHRRRLVWRGYNQSLVLAHGVGRALARPVDSGCLERVRHTPPQTSLDAAGRAVNIKGAFRADPELVQDRNLMLVDDVYTTGATLRECARTLKRVGAASVTVLVLSRAGEGATAVPGNGCPS